MRISNPVIKIMFCFVEVWILNLWSLYLSSSFVLAVKVKWWTISLGNMTHLIVSDWISATLTRKQYIFWKKKLNVLLQRMLIQCIFRCIAKTEGKANNKFCQNESIGLATFLIDCKFDPGPEIACTKRALKAILSRHPFGSVSQHIPPFPALHHP